MTSTLYTDFVGPAVNAAWLNDVNRLTYNKVFGDTSVATTGLTVDTLVVNVVNVAALRMLSKTQYSRAATQGYYTLADGGGGNYSYIATDTTSADNGGSIIVAADGGRWYLESNGVANVKQWGAHGDGITDDSASITAAQGVDGYAYIPAGGYYVSGVKPDGLWGEGTLLYLGTQEIIIARSARMASKLRTISAKLGGLGWSAGSIGLVGDSISEGYYTTDIEHTWFNILAKMLSIGVVSELSGSEPEMTNMSDPYRYGVAYTGTTATGGTGPVQRSVILQPGAAITFTGAYGYVDVCYQQSPGGGSLVMAVNGTPFRTISTAGSAANDLSTFPSATGVTSSASYTLTATGAPVEITGLFRLAATSVAVNSMFFMRFALTSQSTVMMSQDLVIASQMAHMKALNLASQGLIFCAIMVNNANPIAGSVSPLAYQAGLQKMFTRYLAEGYSVIAIGGIPIAPGAYPTVAPNYPAISVAQRETCRQYGIPLIEMEQLDFANDTQFGGGLQYDGLHPNNAGNLAMLELITDVLASPDFNISGNTQPNAMYSYAPTFIWDNDGSAATIGGTITGRYWLNGSQCKVQINAIGLASTGTPSGFCVTLPFTANDTVSASGNVGQITGITNPGYQWTVQSVPTTQRAIIRTLTPSTGVYNDINSTFTNGIIDLNLEYTIQV